MEISDFKLEDSAIMPVRHLATGQPIKTKDGKAVSVTVACKDSEVFRLLARNQTERRLKRASETGNSRLSSTELEDEALDLLAGSTLGWSGITKDGAEFPFSFENARGLYRELPWLRDQVDAFIADRANFMKASAKG